MNSYPKTVIVKYNGGKITDIWKLNERIKDTTASMFIDNNGSEIYLVGDRKVIVVKNEKEWNQYDEYHLTSKQYRRRRLDLEFTS